MIEREVGRRPQARAVASRGAGALGGALQVLFYVGFVPLPGRLVMPRVMETKGRELAD